MSQHKAQAITRLSDPLSVMIKTWRHRLKIRRYFSLFIFYCCIGQSNMFLLAICVQFLCNSLPSFSPSLISSLIFSLIFYVSIPPIWGWSWQLTYRKTLEKRIGQLEGRERLFLFVFVFFLIFFFVNKTNMRFLNQNVSWGF